MHLKMLNVHHGIQALKRLGIYLIWWTFKHAYVVMIMISFDFDGPLHEI